MQNQFKEKYDNIISDLIEGLIKDDIHIGDYDQNKDYKSIAIEILAKEYVNNKIQQETIGEELATIIEKSIENYVIKLKEEQKRNKEEIDKITNVSNTPYNNPNYSQINAPGRSWIFEYTLALCKEVFRAHGLVAGKTSSKYGDLYQFKTEAFCNDSRTTKVLRRTIFHDGNGRLERFNYRY